MKLLALTVLPSVVFAASNTVPLALWTSHSDLSSLEATTSASALLDSVLSGADICNHEAIVFIDHPGVHASDLRALSTTSSILQSLKSSHTSRQFPYAPNDMVPLDIPSAAESVASRCGSRLVNLSPGMGGVQLEKDSKHVVCMSMPEMHGDHPHGRIGMMHEHDTLLSTELTALKSTFPKHLVIFAGTPATSPYLKRQAPDGSHPTRPSISEDPEESGMMSIPELNDPDFTPGPKPSIFVATNGNSTVPKNAGVLKKYQILTPGLILSLIVAFGLLIPIVLVGFSALASIQSPLSTSAPKGFDATSKKNQ